METLCPKCESPNRAGARFCVRCGQPLPNVVPTPQPPPAPVPEPAPASPPPAWQPQQRPAAPLTWAQPQSSAAAPPPYVPQPAQAAYAPPVNYAAASVSTGKGHRFIGPAGAAAFLLFFLPWISVSCQGKHVMSVSGFNLAAGSEVASAYGPAQLPSTPILFLMLLAAIACIVVGVLVYLRRLPKRIGAVAALAAVAIGLLALLNAGSTQTATQGADTSLMRIDPQLGLIGTLIAYVVIVVGAVLDLRTKP